MAKYAILVFYFVATIFATDSYKILGIFPSLDRSNYLTYRELFTELANRNHEVTLISHFQLPNAPASYKDVPLSEKQVYKGLSYESVIVNEVSRVPFETLVSTKSGNDDCKTLMNNHKVLHLISTRAKFDVIIVESYNSDCGLALASNLSAPYISFNPQPLQLWQYPRMGITFNSAFAPQPGLLYGKEPWFFERLISFLLYHISNWVYYVGSQVTDHVFLYKYLGDELPSLESIASNASMAFVNTHQSVFGGITRPDNIIDIGGIHIRPPKIIPTTTGKGQQVNGPPDGKWSLPIPPADALEESCKSKWNDKRIAHPETKEIERFINEAEYGVVYVNLGSTVKDSTMPKEKLNELIETFSKLPHRVIWKWEGVLEKLPRNVMTMRWFPQYDILKHDNVKVFISHAGILSTIEAIDAGVPVVAIPLFGDQYGNAAAMRDAGFATIVSYQDLKKEYLLDAINEVLDPNWQQQAKFVSRIWHDRPMSPLETAIYWTEYVARYRGAPNLKPTSVQKPWYQQLQIDVLAFTALVVYILAKVLNKIFCSCCCCCCTTEASVSISEAKNTKRVKFE